MADRARSCRSILSSYGRAHTNCTLSLSWHLDRLRCRTLQEPLVLARTLQEPLVLARTLQEPLVLARTLQEPLVLARTLQEPLVLARTLQEPLVLARTLQEPLLAPGRAIVGYHPRSSAVPIHCDGFGWGLRMVLRPWRPVRLATRVHCIFRGGALNDGNGVLRDRALVADGASLVEWRCCRMLLMVRMKAVEGKCLGSARVSFP